MLKITSFSAVIIGLLLAMPLIFSEAEASRTQTAPDHNAARTDRAAAERLVAAFQLLGVCDQPLAGVDCQVKAEPRDGATAVPQTITIETRDEAAQTSTLVRIPVAESAPN